MENRSDILVTGGAGFIGTHLCRILTGAGHRVRVLDLVSPRAGVPGVEYYRGDIRNARQMEEAVEGVDVVYHFAAVVSVGICQEHPVESYRTNVLGTIQVLEAVKEEALRRRKKLKVIFAGSSAVYGNTGDDGKEISEAQAQSPGNEPQGYYAAQKLASEHAIRVFHRLHRLPAVIFRFFNVFGPGQDPSSPYSGVISIFGKRLKEGAPLLLNGGGAQTRDFVSVHDIARANALALDLAEDLCDANPINLGSGRSISIRELASLMLKISGKSILMSDAPWRGGDVLHSRADTRRARELLGWSPAVTLTDGLGELFQLP